MRASLTPTFTSTVRNWRKITASTLVRALSLSLLAVLPITVATAPTATASAYTDGNLTCDATGDGSIRVTASHGKAFYVDGTQSLAANDIDASYIGYRVSTSSGTPITNAWVKIKSFTNVVTVATSTKLTTELKAAAGDSDKFQIANRDSNLTSAETRTAFFLLKATNVNNWGNSDVAYGQFNHIVEVYNGDPDVNGSVIRQCTYSFTKITNTIAAAANKVTSLTASKLAPQLGETITITAVGATGTIGAGEAPDGDIIWLSAAPFSSFPLRSLRLERTSFAGGSGTCLSIPRINQLLIPAAASSGCQGDYTAIYTFRVIGAGPANQIVAPVAQISSGTQIKHTSVRTISLDLSKASASNISMAKGIESATSTADSVTVGGIYYARVGYVETASVISGTASLDFIVDSPTAGAIMETTTANGGYLPTYKVGSGSAITIIPTYANGKYYFDGPFTFSSTSPLVIRYSMLLPIPASGSKTFENIVFGNIGGKEIYANAGIPLAAVIVSNDGGTVASTGFKKSAPVVATVQATDITDTSAIIRGSLEALSETTTLRFEWGTSPTLAESTTVSKDTTTVVITDTTTAQTSHSLTGLTPGVTYYFRYVGVGDSGLITFGEILSFKVGLTSVTTSAAVNVRFTSAVITGNFVDVRIAGTRFVFYWSSDSASVSSRTSESVTVEISTSTGSGVLTETSTALSGLSAGTTYYYRLVAESATSGSLFDAGDILQFDTGFTRTDPATSITQTSATLNGALAYRDMDFTSLDMKFIWGTSADLSTDTQTVNASPASLDVGGSITLLLSGLTAGTKYYFRALSDSATVRNLGAIREFTTTAVSVPTPAPEPAPTAPPVNITWPTPGPLTYPAPLGGSQLNAVATCNGVAVTGTYVYSPALGTILLPGTHVLTVTFIPNSSSGCAAASTQVRIVVTAPVATITWPTPPTAQGPLTLGPSQLNAVCSVPGVLTYTPAAGTVLQAGTYTLSVTCTPTDTRIAPATTTVPLTVVAELAKITWPTPAPQEGPLTLGAAQLNATCSVPSTLVYDPKLGTVLEPGTYVLKVTCVPTDPKIPSVTTTVTLVITDAIKTPQNAKTSPITFTRGSITWDPVKNAVGYSVDIRGAVVCTTTTATSCNVPRTIGPKTPVLVTAIDKDRKTASARAVYFNDKLLTAIEINFATNKFNIDRKSQAEINRVTAIIKREGFTFVEITGHTDPRGGAINIALSKNRAKSLVAAMSKLVPGLESRDAGLAANRPKADNGTAAGMAMNRRSVGAVR